MKQHPSDSKQATITTGHRAVYGIHAVGELLRRRTTPVSALFIHQEPHEGESSPIQSLLQKAQDYGIQILIRPRTELDRMAGMGVHQGIVALCDEYRYIELKDLIRKTTQDTKPPLFLILDGVTDPHNLGSLIRSAYVMGVHGLILPHDRSASINATVVKTSSGATEWLPIAKVPNLVRAMQLLQESGVWLCGTTLAGQQTKPPWEIDFTVPIGLVLGSEGYGLRPLVQKTCDLLVHIPMQGQLRGGSLNVSICGGVLLYEVLKQRNSI